MRWYGSAFEDFCAFDAHGRVHKRADRFAECVDSAMMVDEFHKIIQYNIVTGHVRSFLKV